MAISEQRKLPGSYLFGATVLGQMQLLLGGDRAKAEATVAEALRQQPLTTMPAADRPYSDLARFYAMAGHPAQGRSLMTEYRTAVPEARRHRDSGAADAEGHLALAEGKGAEAATYFRAAYDTSGCSNCLLFDLASALEQANQPDSALAAYTMAAEQPATLDRLYTDFWSVARNYRRLGELHEARGENDKALEYYGEFTALWKDADPELQPQVREVKQRMAKLAGEHTP